MSSATLQQNLTKQLSALDTFWRKQGAKSGLSTKTVTIQFTFTGDNEARIRSLSDSLEQYKTRVQERGIFKRRWVCTCRSLPMSITYDTMMQWVKYMVMQGAKHKCSFDSFKVIIPKS